MNSLSFTAKVAGLVLATFAVCTLGATPQVRWVVDPSDARKVSVEVMNLDPKVIEASANWDAMRWQQVLAVRVVQKDSADVPAMLGSYRVEAGILWFQPQFPLAAGVKYQAIFHPDKTSSIASDFELPAAAAKPRTFVKQIYPSASTVPENLLKFYVEFSAPMRRGDIYDHIHLRSEDGKEVELPFLQINEELWAPSMTRVTLLIDPGRIKRGVTPLLEIGPVLEADKHYALTIDHAWKDADGNELKENFVKKFDVGPPDRKAIDPTTWKVTSPKLQTSDALAISFGEPLDEALATRVIDVTDESGKRVDGRVTLEDHEQRWLFTPASPWRAGKYKIVVATTIEDLAGNNIGKLFDVDLFNDVQKQIETPTVTLPFDVR